MGLRDNGGTNDTYTLSFIDSLKEVLEAPTYKSEETSFPIYCIKNNNIIISFFYNDNCEREHHFATPEELSMPCHPRDIRY